MLSLIKSIQAQIGVLTNNMSILSAQIKHPLVNIKSQKSDGNAAGAIKSLLKVNIPVKQNKIGRKKVLILADSHGRGCGSILSQFLNNTYDISSMVKPGAGINEIVKMVRQQTAHFDENDFVVIMGGSNDVVRDGSHSAKFINALDELLPLSKKTNIIINTLPVSSWDLDRINMVTNTNRSIHRVINRATDKNSANIFINFLENIIVNEHFNKSGRHLNDLGKRVLCKKLSMFITNKFNVTKKRVKPTFMDCWLKTNTCKPASKATIGLSQNDSSIRKPITAITSGTFLDKWLRTSILT